MKKIFKLMICFIIILIISFENINIVQARVDDTSGDDRLGQSLGIDSVIKNADEKLKNTESNENNYINMSGLQEYSKQIFNTFFIIGMVLTVIIGGVIGIKFMMASTEDKAKIKEIMIPYIIGCVVIFGAYGIWSLVVNVLNTIN